MSFLWIILVIVFHWYASLFFQTIFLHRYASHNMFKLSPFMERVFYFLTFLTQGSSFLDPRAYAVLHKLHHKHSDNDLDPHSPVQNSNVIIMMWRTFRTFQEIGQNPEQYGDIKVGVKPWPFLDRISALWVTRIILGALWVGIYSLFVEYWWQYLFVPIHWMMGPIHGTIVNWCGHKYGYQNFENDDNSKNTLLIDFLMMGELYQNNHHKFPNRPKFATRKIELDFGYLSLKILSWFRLIRMNS